MKTTIIKTSFDCLTFQQSSQEQIAEEIKNLSYSEQVKFFKRKINESDLKAWWEAINNK